MILLDLCYDSGENEVLFVKVGARVLDIWLDKSLVPHALGPKYHKVVFRPQTASVTALRSKFFFM